MLIWTFGGTALALNDAKRDLAVVEIVYRKSMMAAFDCLLSGSVQYWLKKTPLKILGNCLMLLSVEFCWYVMCDSSRCSIVVVRRLFIWVAGHLSNRLPLNICCPQLLSTTSCEKELLDWNRREFLPFKVFLLLRLSVHLPRLVSSLVAGEDLLLIRRALTCTDKTHGLV